MPCGQVAKTLIFEHSSNLILPIDTELLRNPKGKKREEKKGKTSMPAELSSMGFIDTENQNLSYLTLKNQLNKQHRRLQSRPINTWTLHNPRLFLHRKHPSRITVQEQRRYVQSESKMRKQNEDIQHFNFQEQCLTIH